MWKRVMTLWVIVAFALGSPVALADPVGVSESPQVIGDVIPFTGNTATPQGIPTNMLIQQQAMNSLAVAAAPPPPPPTTIDPAKGNQAAITQALQTLGSYFINTVVPGIFNGYAHSVFNQDIPTIVNLVQQYAQCCVTVSVVNNGQGLQVVIVADPSEGEMTIDVTRNGSGLQITVTVGGETFTFGSIDELKEWAKQRYGPDDEEGEEGEEEEEEEEE